ncbi:MAG TPA: T9SS type A sorting domain-containing protein [Bacteroidia bacterium]|nr:T9SS type A sorting domain-containing protein [Bacteroidia bacterium]
MKNGILTFLSCILLLISQQSRASHAMGAEINYECLGNNQYRITMFFYRDCMGIPAPAQMSIDITSSCFPDQTILLSPTVPVPQQISTVCPTTTTTCNGGIYTGIEAWEYEGIVTLPGECADWRFAHSEASRNAAITTITGAGSDNQYVYSLLNNTNATCNNSPYFANPPVPFACIGQQFCYTNAAYDADGDSLAYSLITPLTGPGLTVTYLSGYTAAQPLVSSPPVTFNSTTGVMCMLPTQTDVTVFAILVSEYRNGVLIGETERDVQLTINNCNNSVPLITGINGTLGSTMNACPNIPVEFYMYAMDNDAADATMLSWDGGIYPANFITSGTHRDTAYFSWTPSSVDVATVPHCFSASVIDDHCPYFGTSSKTFCITVLPSSDAYCIALGMSSIENLQHLVIYPNPANDNIQIKATHPGELKIVDEAGRIVFQKNVTSIQETKVDISQFAKGIYQVLVNSPFLRSKGRFIVQ